MKFKRLLLIILIFFACGVPPKEKALTILRDGIKDQSAIIRLNAARGLKETGDAEGLKVIYEILKSGDKDAVGTALDVLYEIGEKGLSPSILALCRSENPLIRTEAYRLVSRSTDQAGREALIKGTEDKIGKVRKYAYLGLMNFQENDLIHRGLRDTDQSVRLNCAMALGKLGEKGMENVIKAELNKNMSAEFLVEGCEALAGLGDTTVIPFFKELLVDMPWDIRIAAADALLKFKKRDGVAVIKEGLKSNDPFVRVKCVDIIRRYPQADFYDLLKPCLEDMYINVSIGALRAMAAYKKKESAPFFEKMMAAPNPLVRIAAATAYLQIP
jgi:HEAT repeat protein